MWHNNWINNNHRRLKMRDISGEKKIEQFLHCGKCLDEWKLTSGISPQEFQRISVGWTVVGFQIWCNRHDCNILHVDFEGVTHPANTCAVVDD